MVNIISDSLAQQWAKKYVQNLQVDTSSQNNSDTITLSEIVSLEGREKTAKKMIESLRLVSAKAWNKTESLLSDGIKQHNIDPAIIDPWQITLDSFGIYQKALDVYSQKTELRPLNLFIQLMEQGKPLDQKALEIYTEQVAPSELSTVISADIGAIRNKHASLDPRIIGYVSMQFHYTSQMLLEPLHPLEKALVGAYFKVIDDHLYMPLQRAYEAAANHDYNSPVLSAVQKLLPVSTQIAKKICQKVINLFPNYHSLSGVLTDTLVKTSSIRDVEMFQVYLWLCALEGNVSSIQEELFPLCVMLYPRLQVEWELIRQMLHLLRYEIYEYLTPPQANILMSSFRVLSQMFSVDVLE